MKRHKNPMRRARRLAILILGADLWLLAACHKTSEKQEVDTFKQTVLASLGDRKITVADYEDLFYEMPADAQRFFSAPRNRRILLFYLSDPELKSWLIRKGQQLQNRDMLMEENQMTLLPDLDYHSPPAEPLVRSLPPTLDLGEISITPSAIRRYYGYHKDRYEKALLVHAAFLYIPTARAFIDVQNKLNAGAAFEKAGRTKEVTFLIDCRKPTFLERELLLMQRGQISSGLADGTGYAIFRLNAVEPATVQTVRPFLADVIWQERLNDWIAHHWEDLNIQFDKDMLSALELRPPQ